MTSVNQSTYKVAVFGATGNMGKLFVQQALDVGHTLRVLVRNAPKLEHQDHPQIEVVVGDVTQSEDVAKAVEGVDVVVSCLGNVGNLLIMETATENILAAAAAQPTIPRCLLISTIGCNGSSWLVKQMLVLINGRKGFHDYEQADQRILDEKTVPCVLVRPYALTDKPGNGKYNASEKKDGTFMRPIPRADVATFLVDAVTDTRWDRKPGIQLGGKR